ncbi:hypothetical protein [Lunatimonas salinarum]|uniref:hypothetical protein n=1 Tax=Lunatimonas salinarum TaxID=1774590 RepID=UPI001ADEC70A|nr:hypothetical protein [Lunatimonas salinarum]
MKKKKTLQKATMAAGVVAMSVGLFNSFDAEGNGGSSGGACGLGENANFEMCQNENCWSQPGLQCTFWYGADLITSWGKKSRS